MIRLRRGLDVAVAGAPAPRIEAGPPIRHVALVGDDHVGLRPRFAARVGDVVRCGQLLFTDRRSESIRFTAPAAGEVVAIRRAERRRFVSVVIRVAGDDAVTFPVPSRPDAGEIRALLVASGLWTAFRARPFGRIPRPGTSPHALFVTALDTEPLAPAPADVLAGRETDFTRGLALLARAVDVPVHLCVRPGAALPGAGVDGVETHAFAGPHPAGLPGTHIHFLFGAAPDRIAWHAGYEDVAAIGALFRTGRLPQARVVALTGPMVERRCLVRTRVGASLDELLADRLRPGPRRVLSGSALAGRPSAFLGRYDRQVCVLSDARPRPLLGWLRPRRDRRARDTSLHGEPRAIVPTGAYERVMPLDLLATPLLKALAVDDDERAAELGCVELVEEDLALCSYVCPSKNDFGPALRRALTRIESER